MDSVDEESVTCLGCMKTFPSTASMIGHQCEIDRDNHKLFGKNHVKCESETPNGEMLFQNETTTENEGVLFNQAMKSERENEVDHIHMKRKGNVSSSDDSESEGLLSTVTARPRKRTHVCSVCKKTFCNNRYLKIHMRQHTGETL